MGSSQSPYVMFLGHCQLGIDCYRNVFKPVFAEMPSILDGTKCIIFSPVL